MTINLRSEFIRLTNSSAEKKINIRKIVNFIEGDQAGQSRVKQDLAARGGQNTKEMQVK